MATTTNLWSEIASIIILTMQLLLRNIYSICRINTHHAFLHLLINILMLVLLVGGDLVIMLGTNLSQIIIFGLASHKLVLIEVTAYSIETLYILLL